MSTIRPELDFNPEAYIKAIDTKDFLRLVVIGHLYITAVLIELIRQRVPSPEGLRLDRWRFPQVVELAIALDALKPQDVQPLFLLNQLRNKLAHRLGAIVTVGEVEDFLKSMSNEQRRLIEAIIHRPIAWGVDLQPALLVLYVDLHSRLSRAPEA